MLSRLSATRVWTFDFAHIMYLLMRYSDPVMDGIGETLGVECTIWFHGRRSGEEAKVSLKLLVRSTFWQEWPTSSGFDFYTVACF